MTDLELLRSLKRFEEALDAHLKQDAERHEAAMLFAEQRDKVKAELAELREAVGDFIAVPKMPTKGNEAQFQRAYRHLRQLVEEEP